MQYGIYYAYWETEWGGNFVPYVEKCARLGFDVLEVACGAFDRENDAFFHELAAAARGNGMALTGGYGPRKEHDLATADNAQGRADLPLLRRYVPQDGACRDRPARRRALFLLARARYAADR